MRTDSYDCTDDITWSDKEGAEMDRGCGRTMELERVLGLSGLWDSDGHRD